MSRFGQTLHRDLRQIADRATPSSDAWAQIQSRIADQEPLEETEIIMLTDNTFTKRRWPVVAAAAAVAALAIGAIALVNRSDDAIPADDPPAPTIAPAPEAVDEVATPTSAAVDNGSATDVRTVTLTGTFKSSYSLTYTDGGNGGAKGSETWTGQIDASIETNGNFRNSNDAGAIGRSLNVLTGSIDGIGSGTLSYTLEWTRVQLDVVGEGTITGGTGDFADATGTIASQWVAVPSTDTFGTGTGTYSIDLTLPVD